MKKIVAFGASNSSKSINRQLAKWASSSLSDVEVVFLDLNDFEMPIYSTDREQKSGFPAEAQEFKKHLNDSSGIIISFAEYNGSYSSAFKNIFDWISRIEKPIWSKKPMFLLGTSPGGRGAQTVLATAIASFPHQGGDVVASFSLPSFHQNFTEEDGIKDAELKTAFEKQLASFSSSI